MVITIKKDSFSHFDTDEYVVDLSRKFEGYQKGDMVCEVYPFSMPLRLIFAIRVDGSFVFRSWSFTDRRPNHYIHTSENPERFTATQEQIDTVNGLFSGRIRFEGLKLPVGATVQEICPIDLEREEKLTGKRIYCC